MAVKTLPVVGPAGEGGKGGTMEGESREAPSVQFYYFMVKS